MRNIFSNVCLVWEWMRVWDSLMRFCKFSKGEFRGVLAMLLLIIILYAVVFLFSPHAESSVDLSDFQSMVEQFEAEQVRLADSVAAARNRNWNRTSYAGRNSSTYSLHASVSMRDSLQPKPVRQVGYSIQKVELNRCDTSAIMNVPLFGSKRAAKMVEYRDKLGGFYTYGQIREVYILQNMKDDFLAKYFTIDRSLIRKIAINKATYKEMIRHPYFDAYLVKTILNYRQKSGAIKSAEEFQRVTHAYPELMEKLTPYLSFD